MNPHRFQLEPYKGRKSRYKCPQCEKEGKFTRYLDNSTGQYLDPLVGKCSRINNCGYHYPPKQFLTDHPDSTRPSDLRQDWKPSPLTPSTKKPDSIIDFSFLEISKQRYHLNPFVKWLQTLFGQEIALETANRYHIGTATKWNGSTVFWQVDSRGKVRTGKVMHYCQKTGRRTKVPSERIDWADRLLKLSDFQRGYCLFGEHLLYIEPSKVIAIVESEKTAVICSLFLPEFLWMATGGSSHFKVELFEALKGRDVVIFPDLKAFDDWNKKAKSLQGLGKVIVSDFLEKNAPQAHREKGYDLADYFVRQCPSTGFALAEAGYPAFWDMERWT